MGRGEWGSEEHQGPCRRRGGGRCLCRRGASHPCKPGTPLGNQLAPTLQSRTVASEIKPDYGDNLMILVLKLSLKQVLCDNEGN